MRSIHISDVEGKKAVCFDTGLDPRAFARTKMSQSLIEKGYIVFPDGTHEVWKPSGVSEVNGSMRVWGPPFKGERLDLLVNEESSIGTRQTPRKSYQATALQAVVYWIRAKMLLGDDIHSSLNPGTAFIVCEDEQVSAPEQGKYPKGSVFFAPPNLSNRCLIVEKTESEIRQLVGSSAKQLTKRERFTTSDVPVLDHFNCPDLTGMDAAAFCAGVMLYKIFTNVHPYPSDVTIFQDMREGVFLPPYLAAPGLNKKLCDLIQSALLLPVERRRTGESGTDIIVKLLKILMETENLSAQTDGIVPVVSLFRVLPREENIRLESEKKRFYFAQNSSTRLRRFVVRNKHALIGTMLGLFFVLFIVVSTANSINRRPTTEGMAADTVIMAYYEAFSSLDHIFMEACINGASRTDINVAANFFAVNRTRQAYEQSTRSTIIPARVWRETGGELPAPNVFGVTDLTIEFLAGREEDNMLIYRANYLLWSPEEYSISRSDTLTLRRDRRKNWRITEIIRAER
jgi:hypothetical protein